MRTRLLVSGVMAMLALLATAACSSEPTAELNAAQAALDQAKTAEADVYAPQQYQQLQAALGEIQAGIKAENEKFALFRDYDPLKQRAVEFRQTADATVQAAQAEKDRVRQEVEQALAEAESALTAAREALAKAPKGKGTKADLDALTADLDAVASALTTARQSVESGKYLEAKSQIESAKAQADSVAAEVAQALTRRGR
jgi:hypothetical protein